MPDPIRIEILNNAEIAKKYQQRAKNVIDSVQRIISKVALTVERYGKLYSPVKTGLMRSTIYPVDISTSEAWVGPKTVYAPFVHKRIPFMFAAREDADREVEQIISNEIKSALK